MKERSREMGSSPPTAEEIFRDYCALRTDAVHSLTNESIVIGQKLLQASCKSVQRNQDLLISNTSAIGNGIKVGSWEEEAGSLPFLARVWKLTRSDFNAFRSDEDCFILKLEAELSTLKARSSSNVEIIRHTVWGHFSQKTGLLVQLEDSHLLRIKSAGNDHSIFWETTMESYIQDYRNVEGISIAHGGKTCVSLFRFGDSTEGHSRTRMEEAWEIEEVDFNIKGLSMDCFLPPGDLKKEEKEGKCGAMVTSAHSKLPYKIRSASWRISASKVAALNVEYDSEDSDNSD